MKYGFLASALCVLSVAWISPPSKSGLSPAPTPGQTMSHSTRDILNAGMVENCVVFGSDVLNLHVASIHRLSMIHDRLSVQLCMT